MYLLLLSVSSMLQNLRPSVSQEVSKSAEYFTLNSMLVTYLSVDFTLVFVYPYFFGGSSADKNSVANSASGGGLGSTSNHQAQVDLDNG